jgi:hypothetical protein
LLTKIININNKICVHRVAHYTCDALHENIEMVSKPQIVFESKASIRFKSGAYTQYVSILNRIGMHLSVIKSMRIPLCGATQLSGTRWGFETTSKKLKENPRRCPNN